MEEKISIKEVLHCAREENEVREYVLTKQMQRPKTNGLTLVLYFIAYVTFVFFLSRAAIALFEIKKLRWLVYLGGYLLVLLCCSNFFAIKMIECYQHYAKEETRRRCMCKPTCSEYAIAVLKKYFIFKALRKIRIRLYKTCDGSAYKLDLP